MAIDRTVKFTVRLNMLNPAHVTIKLNCNPRFHTRYLG